MGVLNVILLLIVFGLIIWFKSMSDDDEQETASIDYEDKDNDLSVGSQEQLL